MKERYKKQVFYSGCGLSCDHAKLGFFFSHRAIQRAGMRTSMVQKIVPIYSGYVLYFNNADSYKGWYKKHVS